MNKNYKQLELPLEFPPVQPNPYTPLLDPYWDELIVLEHTQLEESVLEQEHEEVAPEQGRCCIYPTNVAPEHIQWVEVYSPSNRKKHKYYRYCWMEGRKIRHVHLRGGSVSNPAAIALKERVEMAIATGSSPTEVTALLTTHKTH